MSSLVNVGPVAVTNFYLQNTPSPFALFGLDSVGLWSFLSQLPFNDPLTGDGGTSFLPLRFKFGPKFLLVILRNRTRFFVLVGVKSLCRLSYLIFMSPLPPIEKSHHRVSHLAFICARCVGAIATSSTPSFLIGFFCRDASELNMFLVKINVWFCLWWKRADCRRRKGYWLPKQWRVGCICIATPLQCDC